MPEGTSGVCGGEGGRGVGTGEGLEPKAKASASCVTLGQSLGPLGWRVAPQLCR